MPIYKRGRSSLGAGLVFVDVHTVHEAFAPMGLSFRGFLTWMRQLGVPIVHIGDMRVIRINTLKAALLFISSVGQPDFLVPGCKTLSRPLPKKGSFSRVLDKDAFLKVHKQIIGELLYTYAASGQELSAEVARLADETAQRMLQAALSQSPSRAQFEGSKQAMARLRKAVPMTPDQAMQALAQEQDSQESPNDNPTIQPSN